MGKEKKVSDLTFEKGIENLESIVQHMESGNLPLEQMIEKYEEGVKLIEFCNEKLASAEKKVEVISHSKKETRTKDKKSNEPEDGSDEVSLF